MTVRVEMEGARDGFNRALRLWAAQVGGGAQALRRSGAPALVGVTGAAGSLAGKLSSSASSSRFSPDSPFACLVRRVRHGSRPVSSQGGAQARQGRFAPVSPQRPAGGEGSVARGAMSSSPAGEIEGEGEVLLFQLSNKKIHTIACELIVRPSGSI
jgi:hypothetical protein